jgi:hypothetical protein
MELLQKYSYGYGYGVFELPSPRNAKKRTKMKPHKKKSVGRSVEDIENVRGSVDFFWRPLACACGPHNTGGKHGI